VSRPPSRRPSSYRLTVTLRLRRSWMRWSRRRKERRLVREQTRLRLLMELQAHQLELVQRLQWQAQVAPAVPPRFLTPAPPHRPPPPQVTAPAPEIPETPEQPEQPEQPMPDPREEIALLLGLPQRQS
jgi:hypothetical protein